MTIYYKVTIVWCKYPFHDVIDYKHVEFYEKVKKKYVKISNLKMESNTSIEEKKEYICKELEINKVNIVKIK